ncbi:DUF4062 domain-containing protein [bacterium]|nr:DUF4062 domain-containing protein [bacterium]
MAGPKRLRIFVSSTVYGMEELLDRTYSLLTAFGYEVWMSHKGTIPLRSDRTAFENCLAAVEKCDLFLGIITPEYGSGQDKDDPRQMSITHHELRRAIERGIPRWVLAHDHVVFAWSFLKNLGHHDPETRSKLTLRKTKIFEDLRILNLYEEAIVDGVPLAERFGNWVQKFRTIEDGSLFVTAQFSRYQEVERFIEENFRDLPSRDEEGG